jgi:hypothetical protein
MIAHSFEALYRLKAGWNGEFVSGGLHLPLASDSVSVRSVFHFPLNAPAVAPISFRASLGLNELVSTCILEV